MMESFTDAVQSIATKNPHQSLQATVGLLTTHSVILQKR